MDLSRVLNAKWLQLKGKIREKWGKLSDDDMDRVQGDWDQLVGVIQEKYEISRSKAEAEINKILTEQE